MTKKEIKIENLDDVRAKKQAAEAVADSASAEDANTDNAQTQSSSTQQAEGNSGGDAPGNGVDEVEKMVAEKTSALEKTCSEYVDHLQRMKAEFENYKKRTERERFETTRYANEQFFRKLLPVMDNLKRGCEYAAQNAHDEEIFKGVKLVERQLADLVAEFGVKPFESVGKPFDPNYHEPLYTVENSEVEDNTIVTEMEPGYMIHERVLRAAKVAVSRKPAEEISQEKETEE